MITTIEIINIFIGPFIANTSEHFQNIRVVNHFLTQTGQNSFHMVLNYELVYLGRNCNPTEYKHDYRS